MIRTARLRTPLAVLLFLSGCRYFAPLTPSRVGGPGAVTAGPLPPGALLPSQNLRVGRVLAVDAARGFAIVDVAADAPATALTEGAPLIARTNDLRETARLSASRYVRGRTFGTKIVSGQPSPGDEVVFPAP